MIKIKLFILNLLFFGVYSHAETLTALTSMCNDCHGENGVSMASDVPIIAGFSEITLTDMMNAYVDEARPAQKSKYRSGDINRPETDMKSIIQALSQVDVEALATHYSIQKFVPAKQNFDPALAANGEKLHEERCIKCHEKGGSSAADDSGILAGQWQIYLQKSFNDFRSGVRTTDKQMKKAIDKLSDEQVTALLHYYASQQ